MTDTQDNPYESPGSNAAPIERIPRRLRLPAAVALTLVASTVAFCCTCLPLGFNATMTDLQRYHAEQAGEDVSQLSERVDFLWLLAFGGGGTAALVVGFVVWSWSRRPKPAPRSDEAPASS